MRLKYLDFTKICVLQDRGGQKSQIWAKFSMWLKFLDFAHFHGSCKTRVFKNRRFKQNFQRDSNFLILPNPMFRWTGQTQISNFSKIFYMTQISWFCQISCFAWPGWSKISNLRNISNVTQFSRFCQIACFASPGWSKISNLSKISNMTQIS